MNDKFEELMNSRPTMLIEMSSSGLPATSKTASAIGFPIRFDSESTTPKHTHGGKREGAGRKFTSEPVFTKKLRASKKEKKEFMALLTGDARKDFIRLSNALRFWSEKNS